MNAPLHSNGLRFECTACGQCCKARGAYCYVFVTLPERRRLARHLGLATAAFTKKYCARDANGFFHLRDPSNDCLFLDGERCTVYAARPGQCRTWPFWPENMSRKKWLGEVKRDCPGIGQGRLWSRAEIEALLAEERKRQYQN